MKHGVFISYRREDADGFARSLFQSLTAHFGPDQVFMDVEDIELGLDFVDAIDKSLSACGVLLVLIGRDWLSCVDSRGQRRLDSPDDFVRMEVATALRSKDVRVIPVRVRGAEMPAFEDLPEELRSLTRRNALQLNHDRWNADIDKLLRALERAGVTAKPKAGVDPAQADGTPEPHDSGNVSGSSSQVSSSSRWKLPLIGAAVAVFVLALISGTDQPDQPDQPLDDSSNQGSVVPVPSPPDEQQMPVVTGPVAKPEQSLTPSSVTTLADAELIAEVQQLLTEMGYNPGPVDGQLGGKTTRAIEAFQRRQGLVPDGQVSEQLVDQLDDALDIRDQQTMLSQNQRQPSSPALPNMTGTWYDDAGYQYQIVQQGNQVQYQAVIPLLGTVVGQGQGVLSGRILDYRYQVAGGGQGSGRGTVAEDGRHMEYFVTDLMTGLQSSGVLHKEHMRH